MIEKRKFERIKDGAKVIYKVMGVKGEYPLQVIDMGAGGLKLPLYEKVSRGTLLELHISLSGEAEPFFGLAKVIWQDLKLKKDTKGVPCYETGVEFIKVGIANRKRIVRFIKAHIIRYGRSNI